MIIVFDMGIFLEHDILNSEKRRNIVILVNRCFNTIVDDNLVSSNTLQGIAIKKLSEENDNLWGGLWSFWGSTDPDEKYRSKVADYLDKYIQQDEVMDG